MSADRRTAPGQVAWLGLGSNLGNRAVNLATAVRALAEHMTVRSLSGVYETAPVGYLDQPEFWNMVVSVSTSLDPLALLKVIKDVETTAGRTPTFRMGPRVLDVDILLLGDTIVDTPDLQVPHPGLRERAFVLRPLLELDAGLTDPRDGSLLAALPIDETGVRRLGSAGDVLELSAGRIA